MTEQAHSPESAVTRRFVILMITLAIVLFLVAVALIAYRWLITSEPTTELIIEGNEALAGAEASVKEVNESTGHQAKFGEGGRLAIPFYLDPGAYIVRVTRDGEVLYQAEQTVLPRTRMRIDLTKWERKLPTTVP